MLTHNVEDGFIMTEYIYSRIPEFETFQGNITDFMRMLLMEYLQYAEQMEAEIGKPNRQSAPQ